MALFVTIGRKSHSENDEYTTFASAPHQKIKLRRNKKNIMKNTKTKMKKTEKSFQAREY